MSLKRGALNTTGIVLLALAVFYTSRYWPQRQLLMPAEQPRQDERPDYSITAFHAVDLDEQGRLRYELAAETLVHYATPERAELKAPEMVFYRNNSEAGDATSEPWQLTADTGAIASGGDRLDLHGNVQVARLAEEGSGRMTLQAEQLTVYGREERAATDGPVTLSSPLASLTGKGMNIDMKKGQMHLLSQVRGHYDPP